MEIIRDIRMSIDQQKIFLDNLNDLVILTKRENRELGNNILKLNAEIEKSKRNKLSDFETLNKEIQRLKESFETLEKEYELLKKENENLLQQQFNPKDIKSVVLQFGR